MEIISKWNAQRSAVRSIAWLDLIASRWCAAAKKADNKQRAARKSQNHSPVIYLEDMVDLITPIALRNTLLRLERGNHSEHEFHACDDEQCPSQHA